MVEQEQKNIETEGNIDITEGSDDISEEPAGTTSITRKSKKEKNEDSGFDRSKELRKDIGENVKSILKSIDKDFYSLKKEDADEERILHDILGADKINVSKVYFSENLKKMGVGLNPKDKTMKVVENILRDILLARDGKLGKNMNFDTRDFGIASNVICAIAGNQSEDIKQELIKKFNLLIENERIPTLIQTLESAVLINPNNITDKTTKVGALISIGLLRLDDDFSNEEKIISLAKSVAGALKGVFIKPIFDTSTLLNSAYTVQTLCNYFLASADNEIDKNVSSLDELIKSENDIKNKYIELKHEYMNNYNTELSKCINNYSNTYSDALTVINEFIKSDKIFYKRYLDIIEELRDKYESKPLETLKEFLNLFSHELDFPDNKLILDLLNSIDECQKSDGECIDAYGALGKILLGNLSTIPEIKISLSADIGNISESIKELCEMAKFDKKRLDIFIKELYEQKKLSKSDKLLWIKENISDSEISKKVSTKLNELYEKSYDESKKEHNINKFARSVTDTTSDLNKIFNAMIDKCRALSSEPPLIIMKKKGEETKTKKGGRKSSSSRFIPEKIQPKQETTI